jgi:hypothetical protein
MLIVTAYWSGVLPKITELHFESFRKLNPGIEYRLYLESDKGFEGFIPDYLKSTLERLNIKVVRISLENLLTSASVPIFSKYKNSLFYRIGRYSLAKSLSNFGRLLLKVSRKSEIRLGKTFFTKTMGCSPGHSRIFSGSKMNLAERSDLFRSNIFNQWPNRDFLYVDLDICFIQPLDLDKFSMGAISQWGTTDFGNSAFLYLPKLQRVARERILRELRLGTSALPWILYSKERCQKYGIEIISNKYLDPAWSPGSEIYGKSDRFFKAGPHSASFVEEIRLTNLLVHWHNQWGCIPEEDSPYDVLLKSFKS